MEVLQALKQTEASLSLTADRISALDGKLEDLLFRAQRIASAAKNNLKTNDTMFGYDLQGFRRDVRAFGHEITGLPNMIGALERAAEFSEPAIRPAQAVMRACERVNRALKGLHDRALLAHQHIREAEHKVEAWYLVQEVEQMAQKGQSLPTLANKVLIRVSDPNFQG